MKKKTAQTKAICSRGHTFVKGNGITTCPKCWPGKYKNFVFHKDGSVWAKGKMVKGKCEGFWQWFRKSGTIMRSGYFKAGKQTGKWTTYDAKGKVYKVTDL